MSSPRMHWSRLGLSQHQPTNAVQFRTNISHPFSSLSRTLQAKQRPHWGLRRYRTGPNRKQNIKQIPWSLRSFRFNSSKSTPNQNVNPTPHLGSPKPTPSLSQRLRNLSREYLGVYFALLALDLPFCFLGVRMLGVDRIGHYEHVVLDAFWTVVSIPFPSLGKGTSKAKAVSDGEGFDNATTREGRLGWSADIEAADVLNQGPEASIWTQLALAFVLHKSFIFIRVPLTIAITPKVVRTLRGWGWNVGKRSP